MYSGSDEQTVDEVASRGRWISAGANHTQERRGTTKSPMAYPQAAFADWFEAMEESGNGIDVFAFPYSGSGVAMFAPWRRQLGSGVNLFAVKLPGRETKLEEPPRRELLPLADELAETIVTANRTPESIVLVGFSLGGLLAFEVARSLRRRSRHVDLVVAGAARAPNGRWSRGRLHRLDDDSFIRELNSMYAAIPPAVVADPEMRALLLPMIRADIEMFETYRYQSEEPLPCEIVTLAGTEDSVIQPKHIYPWRQLSSRFRHRSFAGGHYFERTNRRAVLETLRRRFQRLSQDSTGS